jgi:hypothetical protein
MINCNGRGVPMEKVWLESNVFARLRFIAMWTPDVATGDKTWHTIHSTS